MLAIKQKCRNLKYKLQLYWTKSMNAKLETLEHQEKIGIEVA